MVKLISFLGSAAAVLGEVAAEQKFISETVAGALGLSEHETSSPKFKTKIGESGRKEYVDPQLDMMLPKSGLAKNEIMFTCKFNDAKTNN